MVLNALKSQTPPQSSNDLDHHIRRWKNLGLTPQLMLDEARRQGLYAQAYNHGSVDDVRRHLALGHVIVVMHRARTQYHFELIKAIGENKNGEPLITVTDALGKPNNTPGYKTFLFKEFNRTCWQTLKIGVFGKGAKPDDPDARNAYLNIPTGHDCYYLAFSTQDDLAKPTKNQKGPWIDAPAAGANRWANRVAKALNKAMKLLGLKTLRSEWFGAFAT
ncbi:MAG: hypothetical protein QE263_02365 [Vampirovibrionales bacterium]|nr:hypothetical protein [Vampirovibrionales bacterium]